MGDVGELFAGQREATREHHKVMLAKADTTGWTKHTPYHFSRRFGETRMDWWPSSGKAMIGSRMIYGHAKVNAEIKRRLAMTNGQHAAG